MESVAVSCLMKCWLLLVMMIRCRAVYREKKRYQSAVSLGKLLYNHVNDILKWVSNLVTDVQTISNQEITSDNKSGT